MISRPLTQLQIIELSKQIASGHKTSTTIAKVCFEWVRDEIYHRVDHQMNPVTCRASDVLKDKTGYCSFQTMEDCGRYEIRDPKAKYDSSCAFSRLLLGSPHSVHSWIVGIVQIRETLLGKSKRLEPLLAIAKTP